MNNVYLFIETTTPTCDTDHLLQRIHEELHATPAELLTVYCQDNADILAALQLYGRLHRLRIIHDQDDLDLAALTALKAPHLLLINKGEMGQKIARRRTTRDTAIIYTRRPGPEPTPPRFLPGIKKNHGKPSRRRSRRTAHRTS